jgi:carboxyl-terminal processing protease
MDKKWKPIFVISICMVIFLAGPVIYGAKNPFIDETGRLAALGKVWGLLKYYHPEVAKGEIDWDAVLIAAIPAVKAAQDYDSFNQEIDDLIVEAGDVAVKDYNPGTPAHPNEALFKWIKDSTVFNSPVRKKLKLVQKKHIPAENYYVGALDGAGNTTYYNEKKYEYPYIPGENFRLLALFRYWNIIQYFFPYKKDIGEDWEGVLEEFIPRLIEAKTFFSYHMVMKELTVRINDSHGVASSPVLSYYFGYYYVPVEIGFIEGKTIVTRVYPELMEVPGNIGDLRVGDIILKYKSTDIDTFREIMRKYAEGSNDPTKERSINEFVRRGNTQQLSYTLLRDGQTVEVSITGYYFSIIRDAWLAANNQLEKWKILPGNIGYVHMGILEGSDVDTAMTELMNTQAIIFDLRNYPNFSPKLISRYLNPEPGEFVKFKIPDLDYPGEFYFTDISTTGTYNPDYYRGRVVLLVNEQTQSRAEYSCMALKTAPDATLIGSQTAGADGNVSYIYLPGNIITYFSGLGVYYPDGSPTQRIGIVPDIEVHPTVPGIQSGRDEVLESAIQFIENN